MGLGGIGYTIRYRIYILKKLLWFGIYKLWDIFILVILEYSWFPINTVSKISKNIIISS